MYNIYIMASILLTTCIAHLYLTIQGIIKLRYHKYSL